MSKLNEQQIIKLFQNQFGSTKFVSEDVEVFKIGNNSFAMSTDTLVQSTDIPSLSNIDDVARKSVVACISDFAAKGVKPNYGLISVTIPRKFSQSKIKELSKGFAKAAKEFNFKILGGDTNEGKELVLQVFLIGICKRIILRKGAKKNDIILTTGPFGYSKIGLRYLLQRQLKKTKFVKKAIKHFLKPTPKLEFCVSIRDYFSSSMDSSDGLSSTLHEMARQSKKKFVITKLPIQTDLKEFAQKNRLNLRDFVFNGGEEYETVFTVNPRNIKKIIKNAKKHKIPLFEIGFVSEGHGVIYQSNNKSFRISDEGWKHFRS